MFEKLKNWYLARIEAKYNNKPVQIPQADFKYPPPSAYEVKQIIEELNVCRKPSKTVWETPPTNIHKNIN